MRPIPAESPPFFHRGPSPLARLAFFGFASIVLMFVDARYRTLEDVRHTAGIVLFPLQRLVRMPGQALDELGAYFASKRDLEAALKAAVADMGRCDARVCIVRAK